MGQPLAYRSLGASASRNRAEVHLHFNAAGVLAAVVVAVVAAAWAFSGAGELTARAALVGHGLASVPVAAQGPLSDALGRQDAAYRVTGLRAHNRRQGVGATFSPRGATIASGSARTRLSLVAYGRPDALHRVAPVAPRVTANRVDYARHGVREWWANGPLGLEQGFDVRSHPSTGRGPLTLSLALSGTLRAHLAGSGVELGGGARALRYAGLSATDAHGRALPSSLRLQAGRLAISVDDRHAAYPVRVDPFVQGRS